jgi:hypothetical protein
VLVSVQQASVQSELRPSLDVLQQAETQQAVELVPVMQVQ